MPDCDYVGFEKPDGTPYIEVHHIQSMADQGDDVIENVAAICPDHHAQAHYGKDCEEIQSQLLAAIRTANEQFLPNNRLA
jgi:5-methylcytosine-specific restriction protein A